MVRPYDPRWGGYNTPRCVARLRVLGSPASIIGLELSRYGAPDLRSAPFRCPKPLSGPTPRNLPIIPGDEGGRRAADPPHRGGAMRCYKVGCELRLLGILGSSSS